MLISVWIMVAWYMVVKKTDDCGRGNLRKDLLIIYASLQAFHARFVYGGVVVLGLKKFSRSSISVALNTKWKERLRNISVTFNLQFDTEY